MLKKSAKIAENAQIPNFGSISTHQKYFFLQKNFFPQFLHIKNHWKNTGTFDFENFCNFQPYLLCSGRHTFSVWVVPRFEQRKKKRKKNWTYDVWDANVWCPTAVVGGTRLSSGGAKFPRFCSNTSYYSDAWSAISVTPVANNPSFQTPFFQLSHSPPSRHCTHRYEKNISSRSSKPNHIECI